MHRPLKITNAGRNESQLSRVGDGTRNRSGLAQASRRERPLHVAIIAPPYYDVPPIAYGGIESVVADLVDGLVDAGQRVTLIGAGKPGTKGDFVRVWDVTMADRLGEAFPEVMNAVRTRQAIERLLRTDTIDVIHDHTYSGPVNAPWYAEMGIPTVVTTHNTVAPGEMRDYYSQLGDTVFMIAITERQRTLAPHLNWIGTVHNALSIDNWPYSADKEDYALFLGRFSAHKGTHIALDAAHDAGVPLVLAAKCSEPSEKRYFADEVAPRLGPTDTLYGVADAAAKRRLLASAQCLLFPVEWEEPFGMVMIEAMACGTPVVALRAGSVPEIVVDGVTGIICDKAAELPLALEAVRHLDPAVCRSHVARHFNTRRMVNGHVSAYRTAISALARRHPLPLAQ